MRVKPLPKSWLIHTVIYEKRLPGKDSYGNPKYDVPVPIEHVRVDDSTYFSRDSTDEKILANALVFVDTTHSTKVPEKFVEDSKITFNGKPYVLKKVIDCYYPNENRIHHFELEVI